MTVNGKVAKGLRKAGNKLACKTDEIANKLGFIPFPGTLNLKLDDILILDDELLAFFDLDGLVKRPLKFRLYKAMLKGIPVLVTRSFSIIADPDDLLEIIADRNLRESLDLKDDDSVSLEFLEK
ncbi:MAG: DUF120 domain-containing protein [Candidatus Wallbacteria bacterium]|nr:DUF120 domain-containing protein [Candidatus Wallbacteria bacterium]